MRYLETGSTDPAFNLACEEYVLEHCTEDDWLMLWQNDRTIVVGRNQNAAAEINRDYVNQNKIKVVRRMTGGGTVYHDLGNLNYSFITDAGAPESRTVIRFSEPVCRALNKMGVHAEVSGRNDILVEGRKVSGVAQRIHHGRILHHGCILFSADMSVLASALKADPEKYASKGIKSVSSRVANISDFIPEKMTVIEFRDHLKAELLNNSGVSSADEGLNSENLVHENGKTEECLPVNVLGSKAFDEINRLAQEKYRDWEWTWGRSPEYSFTNKKRFPEGTLEIRLNVKNGIINNATFYGDFMALTDCTPAAEALIGKRFEREDVMNSLNIPDLNAMFGGMGAKQIEELMFS